MSVPSQSWELPVRLSECAGRIAPVRYVPKRQAHLKSARVRLGRKVRAFEVLSLVWDWGH